MPLEVAEVIAPLVVRHEIERIGRILADISIIRKLGLGFGLIIAVALSSAAFVMLQTRELAEKERVNSSSDKALGYIQRMQADIASSRASIRDYVIGEEPQDRAGVLKALAASSIQAALAREIIVADGPPQLASDLDSYWAAASRYNDRVTRRYVELVDRGQRSQAIAAITAHVGKPYRLAMESRYDRLSRSADGWVRDWDRRGDRAILGTAIGIGISGVLTAAVCGILALLISKTISQPLRGMTSAMMALASGDTDVEIPATQARDEIGNMSRAVAVFKQAAIQRKELEAEAALARRLVDTERTRNEAQRAARSGEQTRVFEHLAAALSALARGDLSHRLDVAFADEYEQVRQDFNLAIEQLAAAIREVASNTVRIGADARTMSRSSAEISTRSAAQALSLRNATMVLDSVTMMIAKSVETVERARRATIVAMEDAERSNEVVERTLGAMNEMERVANQILGMTEYIEGIASQTRVLSLNASVEAARDNLKGGGFSVVATEIRSLARQASTASQEIRALTLATAEQIRNGVALVRQTGSVLIGIIGQVREIHGATAEVYEAARTQSEDLLGANVSIGSIEAANQDNAAEAAAAAHISNSLFKQAQQLERLVSRFKVA